MKAIFDIDNCIVQLDMALRTLVPPKNRASARVSPAEALPDVSLSRAQKKHVSGLMRVNHAGEVAAQALYQGQAFTAKLTHVKQQMLDAALEEVDHLAWCEQRLRELGHQTSVLNPLWYFGSFVIGAAAGLAGDRYSLGFVAETEHQVSAHLQRHLKSLAAEDQKTRLILEKMQEDESQHAIQAKQAGGMDLPKPIKQLMRLVSKIMTKTSYHL